MGGSVWILVFCLFSVAFGSMQNESSITADVLIEMGKMGNRPLLQLLGEAFLDTEEALGKKLREREMEIFQGTGFPGNETFMRHVCELMECSPWTEWSECQTGLYEFSIITRTRQCGVSNKLCTYAESSTKTESKVCREEDIVPTPPPARCPPDYEMVNGQFCLKYVGSGTSQYSATANCQDDGGDLIHVNSQAKNEALEDLLDQHYVGSGTIWLNGKRDYAGGPFEYTYGYQFSSYDNWKSGEPSNGSSELCKVNEGSPRTNWDRGCSDSYYYVCEIEL